MPETENRNEHNPEEVWPEASVQHSKDYADKMNMAFVRTAKTLLDPDQFRKICILSQFNA